MVNVNSSLFIQIVNFLLLIWVLNIVLYRPIRKILLERKEKIEGLEQNVDSLKESRVEKDEAYSKGLRDARALGVAEKEALLKEGADEEREIVDKINKKAQADLAEVRDQILKDVESVRAALLKDIDLFANDIGRKILGRAV